MHYPSFSLSRMIALPAVACVVLVLAPAEGKELAPAEENATLQRLLFPENDGFSVAKLVRADKDGVTEWKFSGLLMEKGLKRMAILNTRDGISAIFNGVANITGNEAYRADVGARTVVVNTRTLENPAYKAGASGNEGHPFTFELVITRRPVSSK